MNEEFNIEVTVVDTKKGLMAFANVTRDGECMNKATAEVVGLQLSQDTARKGQCFTADYKRRLKLEIESKIGDIIVKHSELNKTKTKAKTKVTDPE